MSETWCPIPDFPGYEVSDQGRVRSYYRRMPCEFAHGAVWEIADQPQRILEGYHKGRYPFVVLTQNGQCVNMRIHRLVMLAFVGPCPDGLEVCHNDGNPSHNHLGNLRYDTHRANIQDAKRHGTMTTPPSFRFFTDDEVIEIRKARASGRTYRSLAQEWEVSETAISALCRGKSYANIGGPRASSSISSILDWPTVRHIRQDRRAGTPIALLAERYGVTESAISLIINHKRWAEPEPQSAAEPA